MSSDFAAWTPGRICGALRALFEAGCLEGRTRNELILHDLGLYLRRHQTLTPRQIDAVRYSLPAFQKQLAGLPVEEMAVRVPDEGGDYRFMMHNPKTFRVYAPQRTPILARLKQIAGFQKSPDGYFLVPFSKRNYYVLCHNGFAPEARVAGFLAKPDPALPEVDTSRLGVSVKEYQRRGIASLIARNGRAILADEQGLGKTGQAIAWAYLSEVERICVVCPASVKAVWQREIRKWTGQTDCLLLSGRTARQDILQEIAANRWIIINYDILSVWMPLLAKAHFSAFVFDEAQALKNPAAQRSRTAAKLAKAARHVLMLSGTPCENRPAEFYSIIHMVDPLLFPSVTRYRERYCNLHQNRYGYMDYSGASNTKELHQILTETVMIRRKKADVLSELPDKQRILVPLALSEAHLREYRSAERDFVAWLKANTPDGRTLIRRLRAQALMKLGTLKRLVALAKIPLVLDWVHTYLENEDKLVLFAEQHEVIDAIRREFAEQSVVVDGRVPTEKRPALCDAFQTDPAVRLFVGNIRAAGTGLTLTAAKDTVTVEFGWTSTVHDQCEDRVHRIGQRNCVSAYYLLAENTVEERVVSLLDSKRNIVTQVMDGQDAQAEDLLDGLLAQYGGEK